MADTSDGKIGSEKNAVKTDGSGAWRLSFRRSHAAVSTCLDRVETNEYRLFARRDFACNRILEMKLEGRFTFPAPAQEVWDLLTDPQSLQHCTPGCKQLTEIATDEFEATMEIGMGPIKGTFHGKISMKEKAPPRSYRLIIEGSGAAGFVRGEGALTLQDEAGDQTAVHVSGDGQVGGVMAGVGQRLFEGVAKQLMGQFFQCMQSRLAARKENSSV